MDAGKMVIVNWQCHFTEHQFHLWQEFERQPSVEVLHVVARLSSSTRKKQGWPSVDLSKLKGGSILLGKDWWRQGLSLINDHPQAIHVFGGFWADRRFLPLIVLAMLKGRKVAVMQEGYATEPVGYLEDASSLFARVTVWARPLLYCIMARIVRHLATRQTFCLLALGKDALLQMEMAGFEKAQIFPFGYFVPKQLPRVSARKDESDLHLVFVGSPLRRKGLDLLISAMDALVNEDRTIQLDLYGQGHFPKALPSNVSYRGSITFGKAQEVIAGYDALVLPSRHDGWGVVVNEALLQGVPVVVSSRVGARCLVEHSGSGLIFESGKRDSLIGAIKDLAKIKNEGGFNALQEKAQWVGDRIVPDRAAKYLHRILEYQFNGAGTRPEEPWCR